MGEINKTTKYLFVPFAFEDKSFISNYNLCHKGLKIYLDDTGTDDEYYDGCLYVYFNTSKIVKFEDRLLFFKMYNSYVKDYSISETEHIIIFKYLEQFKNTVTAFVSGWYHLMYENKIIETYFSKHADYLMKYNDVPITERNISVLENLDSLHKDYKLLQLSPYHVLKRSKELRFLISRLYGVDEEIIINLESKPQFSQEVFRWNKDKYIYN